MMKSIILVLTIVLAQSGCTIYEEITSYQPAAFEPAGVESYERLKREMLRLEDITVGNGSLSAAGRKVTADITVRYTDGTLVYQGPAVTYWGFIGDTFIHNSPAESNLLSLSQTGIALGLNGMAVGGKRRIVVPPNLVCYRGSVGDSLDKGADSRKRCGLILPLRSDKGIYEGGAAVHKETLVVEATLTAACRPVFPRIGPFFIGERCRDSEHPKRDPADPIWRFY